MKAHEFLLMLTELHRKWKAQRNQEGSEVEVIFSNEPETRIFPCKTIKFDRQGKVKSVNKHFRLPLPHDYASPTASKIQKNKRKNPKFTIIEFKCVGCERTFEKRRIDGKKDRCPPCQTKKAAKMQKEWREKQRL